MNAHLPSGRNSQQQKLWVWSGYEAVPNTQIQEFDEKTCCEEIPR